MASPVVRLTANISPEVAEQLEKLAKSIGTTKTQALNQAIITAAGLYEEGDNGGRVVVKKAGRREKDVLLPKAAS